MMKACCGDCFNKGWGLREAEPVWYTRYYVSDRRADFSPIGKWTKVADRIHAMIRLCGGAVFDESR